MKGDCLEPRAASISPDRVVIVNCWDDSNKGDAAITTGLLNALKANHAALKYTLVSYVFHPDLPSARQSLRHVLGAHPDVDIVQPSVPALIRSVGKWKGMLSALRCLGKLMAPSLIKDDPMEADIRQSSLVVSNGGLYFGFVEPDHINTLYHLFAFSYPMLLAHRFGVPFILYAQSFGPFHNGMTRRWMRWLFNASAGNWSRESISNKLLLTLGAPSATTHVVPDAAFTVRPDAVEQKGNFDFSALAQDPYVAFSVRQISPTGHSRENEQRYYDSIVSTINWITEERSMRVVLVSHTLGPLVNEDDRIANRQVYRALTPNARERTLQLDADLSPSELAFVYGRAELVVATRFHAVVLTICGGAPVIAIPYFGTKTQGSFRDLGLEDMLLEVRNLSPEVLRDKVMQCLNRRTDLRRKIGIIAEAQFAQATLTGADAAQIAHRHAMHRMS